MVHARFRGNAFMKSSSGTLRGGDLYSILSKLLIQEIRQTDVVQGSSMCEQELFFRHSSQWKRTRSWSSKEWSEPQTVIDCEPS
jgi:hypothetical protein